MTNPINNLTNIFINNQSISKPIQNEQAGQGANPQQNQAYQPQTSFYNQIFETSSLYSLIKMDNSEINKYLQNLLSMPESIVEFIDKATNNEIGQKLAKLIANGELDLNELTVLLNQNSKSAIDKVLKTISNSIASGNSDISQLKDVLSILNSIQTSTNIGTNSLKELLLLYIPLNIQAWENSNVAKNSEDEDKKTDFSSLNILFQTKNFNNMSCIINSIEQDFSIDFKVNNIFPKEKFLLVIEDSLKKLNMACAIDFSLKPDTKEKENDIQNFKVFSNSKVSIKLLILTHLIISNVFKFDNDFSI